MRTLTPVWIIGLVFVFVTVAAASAVRAVPIEARASDHADAGAGVEEAAFVSVSELAVATDLGEFEAAEEEEAEAADENESADELEAESEDESDSDSESDSEDLELMELASSFGPFQAAANVMPYNIAIDPGHNFMNPFIRGYNPAYDGYTPQPGGAMWNNPNGPNWSPFHWSAPASYWSVYPPQYASHYVNPGMYHAPGSHQFFGPNYYGGHTGHKHGPGTFPYDYSMVWRVSPLLHPSPSHPHALT